MRKFYGKKKAESIKKKEQETKRFKKAAALRKYAKLCKREGIQSDRVRIGKKEDKEEGESTSASANTKQQKDHKPFRRAEKEAERQEQLEHDKEQHRLATQKQKEEALRKREEKRKALSKTTRKGQPVLGNHIKSMLQKLQAGH
jgi:hypothetical protein